MPTINTVYRYSKYFVLFLVLGCFPAFATKDYTFVIGNWLGQAHFHKNGVFKSCTMNARYQSGTEIFFVINEHMGWAIGINNADWDLKKGKKLPVRVLVDEYAPVAGSAQNLSKQGFYIIFNKNNNLLDNLKRGNEMVVTKGDFKGRYELRGTSRAIPALRQCALLRSNFEQKVAESKNEENTKKDQQLAKKPDTKNNQVAKLSPTKLPDNEKEKTKPASSNKASSLKRRKALAFAEQLLNKVRVSGYSFLKAKDHPSPGFDVMWKTSNDALGGVQFIDGKNIHRVAGDIISQDASSCKGEFASAKKFADESDDNKRNAWNITTICRRLDGPFEVQYSLVERKDGKFVKIAQTTILSQLDQKDSLWINPEQSFIDGTE